MRSIITLFIIGSILLGFSCKKNAGPRVKSTALLTLNVDSFYLYPRRRVIREDFNNDQNWTLNVERRRGFCTLVPDTVQYDLKVDSGLLIMRPGFEEDGVTNDEGDYTCVRAKWDVHDSTIVKLTNKTALGIGIEMGYKKIDQDILSGAGVRISMQIDSLLLETDISLGTGSVDNLPNPMHLFLTPDTLFYAHHSTNSMTGLFNVVGCPRTDPECPGGAFRTRTLKSGNGLPNTLAINISICMHDFHTFSCWRPVGIFDYIEIYKVY